MLEIKDLRVAVDGKEILKGVNLTIGKGEVHAIMGPNGSGKSTLSYVIAGRDGYEVTGGSILFDGKDILDLEPEERSREGIFLAFQYPLEIAGVNMSTFLRTAYNAHRKHKGEPELDPMQFLKLVRTRTKALGISDEMLKRAVNTGFSGGEKKRNEILQMMMLEPSLVILDEIDSGLDIDALKIVASAVNSMRSPDRSFLIITHYQRLLNYITPDHVHVMMQGRIVKSGGPELALRLEAEGYDWIKEELGITDETVGQEPEEEFKVPMNTIAPKF